MQNINEWLRLPDDETLEAGEDTSKEEQREPFEFSWVPPKPEPDAQAGSFNRKISSYKVDSPVTVYPEEARGRPIWEMFEGPDERLMDRHPESGLGYLRNEDQVDEVLDEAEERAERFMSAQRQLVAAFFARRRNSLYRQAATVALYRAERPEPRLLLLWNLIGDQWIKSDSGTQEEVGRWLSGLGDEDFLFFTQDPDGDPQSVTGSGILPSDLRPMRLFTEHRRRLMRTLIRESGFFHSDGRVFEARLAEKIPQIAGSWDLDEAALLSLAREERARFYELHLAICRASAAFARGKPAPAQVPQNVVAEVASVAYGRMDHPSYKAQALAFAKIQADQAREIFAGLDRFMEDFYASRLFSFIKRATIRRGRTAGKDERLRQAATLLENARKVYRAVMKKNHRLDELTDLRTSIEQLLGTFVEQEVCRVPVLISLKKSLQYLER